MIGGGILASTRGKWHLPRTVASSGIAKPQHVIVYVCQARTRSFARILSLFSSVWASNPDSKAKYIMQTDCHLLRYYLCLSEVPTQIHVSPSSSGNFIVAGSWIHLHSLHSKGSVETAQSTAGTSRPS